MKRLLLAFAVLAAHQLTKADSTGDSHTFRVVASVSDVRMLNHGGQERIASVVFMIHSPAQFEGVRLLIYTESTKRSMVRAEFPVGRLERIDLPNSMLKELSNNRVAAERLEVERDQGTATTSTLSLPHIRMAELPEHPKPLSANP